MASLIFSDLVISTTFRDKWEFWRPVFGDKPDDQRELIERLRASMEEFMYKNFLCENSALGNVFSGADKQRIAEYLNNNSEFFYKDETGFYRLKPDAIKSYAGEYDLNKFFGKKLISESYYEKWLLRAFGFIPEDKPESTSAPSDEQFSK